MTDAVLPLETIDTTLQQAIAHQKAGQLQEAVRLYHVVLQVQPNHAQANHSIGILAVQMEQPAAALSYFMTALDADPTRRQYWLSYIDALFQADQLEDARQMLEFAKQQGLQGDDVDALSVRIERGASEIISTPPVMVTPSPKHAPQSGRKTPSSGEIDALVALFAGGRLAEAATVARTMTERFPQHEFGWKALGAVYKQMGRDADALAPMQKAATLSPGDVEAQYNLGATLQGLGRLVDAEAAYRKALRVNKNYADAHCNLGIILQELGRLDEAEASLRSALQLMPGNAETHSNLGVILQNIGRLDEAEASFRRALKINPNNATAHNNLGNTLKELGRTDEAETSYRHALRLNPDYADAHYNLGKILKELGRREEAEACYRQTLRIKPDNAEAHYNLANTLKEMGQSDAAETSYRKALHIRPNFAEAHSNLGITLKDMGRLDEAAASLRQAIEINPNYANAHNNLGAILQDQNRLKEAEACYRQALQIRPDYAEAHNNLGATLQDQSRFEEAEVSYRSALQIKPDFAEAHNNLGAILRELGRLAEAKSSCHRALELRPDYAPAHQNMAAILAYLSDYDDVVSEINKVSSLQQYSAADWEQRLYIYSYHPDLTAQQIYAEFVRWGDRFPDPVVDFSSHDRNLARRLRIGYVSPDFRRHTSRFYFWPLFANHDHTAVELYAYSNVRQEDDVTQKFKGAFDHWRNIRGVADKEVANMIREDAIDILVDGCSHMRDDRLGVFTLKPAPIQVTWLGAAWTTGLAMVDYALIDPYMAPVGTLTRETIVRLPHSFVAYQPPEETAEIAPPPCLKNGYITFGYTGRTERLNHHTFRVWGEILRKNPTARLILDLRPFADPPTQAHYRQFMIKHGMEPAQVIMRRSTNIFSGLNDIDILLDSFPHSGGTMLFDALWMGVPALTLSGRPPVGRIGTSLMTNLGLPEWVAASQEQYIEKACIFAGNFQTLADIRAGMRERMRNSPLMDGPGFARAVEAAYSEMFGTWAINLTGDTPGKADSTARHIPGRPPVASPTVLKGSQPSPQTCNALLMLFTEARYAEAEKLARKTTVQFPLYGFGWMLLGSALKQLGHSEDALVAMQKAAALSPDDADAHSNLGVTLLDMGRLKEAEQSLKRALEINPDYAQAHNNLGAILQTLNRLDDAEASFRRALQITPDYADAYSNLGNTLRGLGRLDEAEISYRKALQIYPDFIEAHINLGGILKQLGNLNEAKAILRRALQIKADRPDALSLLNDILREQGLLPDYLAPEFFDSANNRLLRRYFPRESSSFVYVIDIAGTCNLRCPSCPVGNFSDATRPKGFMDMALFSAIVEKIKRDGIVKNPTVWLFNWGEPMLHPKLPEMITLLRLNSMYVMISTNLNIKRNLEEVIRSAPDEIKISLSGFTQQFYSKTHTKGNIELVKENMHLIRDFINKYNVPTKVWVGHHIYRHNMHESDAIESLCAALQFDYRPIPAFYQPLERMMDLVEGRLPASDADLLANLPVHPLEVLALKRKAIDNDLDCELRFNMTVINYDGSVALCCGVYDYQNMLGVNFLDASHDEIQALKYKHPLCKKCYEYGLQYSEPKLGRVQ